MDKVEGSKNGLQSWLQKLVCLTVFQRSLSLFTNNENITLRGHIVIFFAIVSEALRTPIGNS